MKIRWILASLAAVLFAAGLHAQSASPSKPAPSKAAPLKTEPSKTDPLKTDKDKTSYALGVAVGKSFQAQGVDLDPNLIAQGLKDTLTNAKLLISDDELRSLMTTFQQAMDEKRAIATAAQANANKEAGAAFLAENGKKDGVVTTESGLQYKVITAGTGAKPTDADTITVLYRGTLIDGKEFDSNNGQPATFEVGGVIPGFREALKLMPVGSKYQFFIPADQAYAERGAGDVIGPNATLIFEVELVSIQGKQATPGTPATPATPAPAPAR